ncbi:hypothetical protein B0H21DRAFT_124049 [Amylocystis lapponica]|nr:hypothetical protein B0H21DRAFT_124049 [Amylocystis lapponica]
MSLVTVEEQLKGLQSFITAGPPYCCGTIPLSPDESVLYYGKDVDRLGRVDLSDATEDALEHLAETCDLATFGVNRTDILDETYRKAGKLDAEHFAMKFDAAKSGLLDVIRANLLKDEDEQRSISAELYKLNVYGKDSFFKSHLDTPRGGAMFGSLVIVFPTPHEGGALVLRHNSEEWTFDSAKTISEHAIPSVAYIAFYSDVEHEVTLVKSGYRVTVTYNLYFTAAPSASLNPAVEEHPVVEPALKAEFRRLLEDRMFMPEGGHIMFGLQHQYPVDLDTYDYEWNGRDALQAISAYLKGSDAAVQRVCRELGLKTSLQLVFEDDERDWLTTLIACDRLVHLVDDAMYEEPLRNVLREEYGGKRLSPLDEDEDEDEDEEDLEVVWATQLPTFNRLRATYLTYGNEASLAYTYANLCLLVDVGGFSMRETVDC